MRAQRYRRMARRALSQARRFKRRYEALRDANYRWEIQPLTYGRWRLVHTDGLNVDRFY